MSSEQVPASWLPPPEVTTAFRARWLRWPDETHTALLAVSGGIDSVALLLIMHAVTPRPQASRLAVAHVNHRWRGEQADREGELVRELASALSLPCYSATLPDGWWNSTSGEGWESAARRLRYDALQQLAQQAAARYVVTGHHQTDQLETLLQRLLRGTGIDGLRGMPTFRPLSEGLTLARPLLDLSRRQLLEFVAATGIEWVEDASNQDPRFFRNRLRQELLPVLDELAAGQWEQSLLQLSQLAGEYEALLAGWEDEIIQRIVVQQAPDRVELARQSLQAFPHGLQKRVLRQLWRTQGWPEQEMSFTKWEQLCVLLSHSRTAERRGEEEKPANAAGATDFPGGIRVSLTAERACLQAVPNE